MLTLEPLAPTHSVIKDSRGRVRTTIHGYRFELLRRKDGSISFNVFRRGEDWERTTQGSFPFTSAEAMRVMTRNPEFTAWLQAAMLIV